MTIIDEVEVVQDFVQLKSTFKTALREVSEFPIIRLILNGNWYGEVVGTPAITGDTFEKILEECLGLTLDGPEVNQNFFSNYIPKLPITRSSMAALDMAARSLIGINRGGLKVQTDVTIPIASIAEYTDLFNERSMFKSFKIKLGCEDIETLVKKLERARELRPDATFRVDPNQSWSREQAIEFLLEIDRRSIKIDYLEQPCNRDDYGAFKAIKNSTGVDLMADESCFTESDIHELLKSGGVDLINLKVLKSGGASQVLRLADIARNEGLRVSIGSMMESELGVREAILLANDIAPDFIHDLDAGWWLKETTLKYENGSVIAP